MEQVKKPQKEKKKETPFQKRVYILTSMNFIFGLVFATFFVSYQDIIGKGLYHKIVPFYGINVPVGILSMVFISVLVAIISLLVLGMDYFVYKQGLEFIKVKEEVKPSSQ